MLTLATTDYLAGVASVAAKLTTTINGMELVGTVESYKTLYQGQLPGAAASLYDPPADTVGFVQSIHIVNTDPSPRTFTLFMNGLDDAHRLYGPITLPAGYAAVYGADGWAVYSDQGQRLGVGATGATGASGGAADYAEDADISTQAFGDTAIAGASVTEVAGANHRHGMPANPITAHVAAGDPHTVYALDSEKGATNGYASLDATTKVPVAQLGTGTPDGTKFLRDDRTFAVPAGGGGGAPSGAAGGDLGGTYPNPSVVDDSHAHSSASVTTHSSTHAHSATTGQTANDHHNRDHASTHLAAGADPLAIPVPQINVFTASGTYTKPAGARSVRVRVVGSGGGGGGAAVSASGTRSGAGSGGGGGYAEKFFAASALGSTETVTIGAAGTAGAGSTPANGGTGGTCSFGASGTLVQATGGAGGEASTASGTQVAHLGGAGGTGSGGDLNVSGGGGGPGVVTPNGVTGAPGGSSAFGGGAVEADVNGTGIAGGAYGGGGSGGIVGVNAALRNGGAGAAGVVIVETYF